MRAVLPIAILAVALASFAAGAQAHSFNVALIVASGTDARQARDGFLLATRERDSHADEESDGHLGGLDVYLFPVDLGAQGGDAVAAVLREREIDILAVVGPDGAGAAVRPLAVGSAAVLLAPGRLRRSSTPRFRAAFETQFGYAPGDAAAAGYNAARRIDAAVRPLGGVDDRAALRRAFDATKDGMDW